MSIDNAMAAYAYYGITTPEDARAADELEQQVTATHHGDCLRLALYQAGIRAGLPDWIHIDDIPTICDRLGLTWIGEGSTVESVTRAIVIYPVERDGVWVGHAEYVDDLMSQINRFEEINGVIVLSHESGNGVGE